MNLMRYSFFSGSAGVSGEGGSSGRTPSTGTGAGLDDSSEDMGELGNGVGIQGIHELPHHVQGDDEDEGDRDLVLPDVRKRAEQYEHEHNPACPVESRSHHEEVQSGRGKGGDDHHAEERDRAVLLLKDGPDQKDEGEVTDQVGPALVADDVREEPKPREE
jgi:hypothetical protein